MATVHGKQNSFIAGVITQEAVERSDKQQIYHGMLEGMNVRVGSHGGVSRRTGTVYVDKVANILDPIKLGYVVTAANGGTPTLLTDEDPNTYFKTTAAIGSNKEYECFRLEFNVSTSVDYFDVYGCSVDNGDERAVGGETGFCIQYSSDGENWITCKEFYLSYLNDDYYRGEIRSKVKCIRVVYQGAKNLPSVKFWANGIGVYKESNRQSGFRLTSLVYGATANYLLSITANRITIYRNSVRITECPLPFVDASYLQQLKFSTTGESIIVTHKEVEPFMIQRYLKDSDWRVFPIVFSNIPHYDATLERETLAGNASVINNNEEYRVKSDTPVFRSTDVGCIISGDGGRGRVIEFGSTTDVRISVINKFAYYGETPKHPGWTIDRNTKPLWGEEYGYPECSAIFANRLFLGGFKRAPDVVAASVIGDYLNFSTGDLQSDDAMVVRLSTGRYNHNIRFIFGCDNLEVFTDIGIFALKKFDSGSITDISSAFYLRKSIGIDPYMQPFRTEDSGTIFLKNGKTDIREITYSNEVYSYTARSLSLWYTDIIKNTISIGVSRKTVDNVTNYVYCVREDGGLGCLNFLLTDNIHIGTNWTTQGKYKACEATLQHAYFVVDRGGKLYIERLEDSAFLDSEIMQRAATGGVIKELNHLAGKTVQVRGDLEYLGEFVVSDTGEITIPEGNWKVLHIGLGFKCVVVPVPPESMQEPVLGKWVRYTQATLSVYDTQEIEVNGLIPEFIGREYANYNQTPMMPKEGRYRVYLGSSGELTPRMRIEQDKPLSFNVRSIGYDVEID